jgi:mannosyltransferase OCH1-like enzyme
MLLNEYGGIYLDCDCFPIRPFDENILISDFICTRYYEKNFIRRDCFFMGKSLE